MSASITSASITNESGNESGSRFSTIRGRRAAGRMAWSFALLAGCVIASAAVFALVPAQTAVPVDADLSRLLRGMALIKAAIVASVSALILWRLGRPVAKPVVTGYLLSLWTMAAATALIWQSSSIIMAALLFHAAGFAVLMLALRDDQMLPARLGLLARR